MCRPLTTAWSAHLERVARSFVWLTLTALASLYVIGKHQDEKEQLDHALKEVEEKGAALERKHADKMSSLANEHAQALKGLEHKRERFIHAPGTFIRWVDLAMGRAGFTFTNAASTEGVLCGSATVRNRKLKDDVKSIVECRKFAPYETATFYTRFAGPDLRAACPPAITCYPTFEPYLPTE